MWEFSSANNPERRLLSVKAFQKTVETFEMKGNEKTKQASKMHVKIMSYSLKN